MKQYQFRDQTQLLHGEDLLVQHLEEAHVETCEVPLGVGSSSVDAAVGVVAFEVGRAHMRNVTAEVAFADRCLG